MKNNLKCSIGVFAYNEAKNISHLLDSLLNQKLYKVKICEIIVVSSASTDGTDKIVADYENKYDKIRLIKEEERNGKSAAINLFLKEAVSDIAVIESGDTIPEEDVIEKFVSAFEDPQIGMVGGRPKPINSTDTLVGYSVNLLWKLHHKMALNSPKLGEMVAFRVIFDKIPPESAVDEASIEAIIIERGYKLKYIPNAIIKNKGPENFRDFIKQRKRIAAGHLWLKDNQSHEVSSQDSNLLLNLFLDEFLINPKDIHKMLITVFVELYSRIRGWFEYKIKNKNPFKWDIAQSTKNLK